MIDFRPFTESLISEAKRLIPEGCPEPDWKNAWAVMGGNEVVGVVGAESRLVVEPLYMEKGKGLHSIAAMAFIDGIMRVAAAQQGKGGYEFFVGDDNPHFQQLIERHLPVTKGREKNGLYYFRKFGS